MTTRANLKIESLGLDWHEAVQLYRHADGYPTSVLPSLLRAHKLSGGGWESGRSGKAAAFICAEGVEDGYAAYEPESDLSYHGDEDWIYILTLFNQHSGCNS